jgi:putative membrane protein
MYFWLKVLHIGAMAIWFGGLVLLPRLLAARHRGGIDAEPTYFNPVAKTLYLRIMTPAGLLAIAFGAALIAYGPQGAWLVLKLVLVALALLLHLYAGMVLYAIGRERERHGPWTYRALGWLPLLLLLGLAALTGAKPATVGDLQPPPGAASSAPRSGAAGIAQRRDQAGGVASSAAPARSSSRSP